jgi:hypothetical protein
VMFHCVIILRHKTRADVFVVDDRARRNCVNCYDTGEKALFCVIRMALPEALSLSA